MMRTYEMDACWNTSESEECDGRLSQYKRMLQDELHADVTIQAAGGAVKAHRAVLASMSPVFEAMFRNDMLEQQISVVKIPTIDIEVLKLFLTFLYSGRGCGVHFTLVDKYLIGFMSACHQYEVLGYKVVSTYACWNTSRPERCWNTSKPEPCDGRLSQYKRMLQDELHADVTIQAAGGAVNAHRAVLASMSPVFEAMFRNDMLEQQISVVKIPTIDIEVLKVFLTFLYCGGGCEAVETDFALVDKYLFDFISACHQYEVLGYEDVCSRSMRRTLSNQNCWSYFWVARKYSIEDCEDTCFEYMKYHYRSIINAESFETAAKDYPELVVAVIRHVASGSG